MKGHLVMSGLNVPPNAYPLPGNIPASGSLGWTTTEADGVFYQNDRDAKVFSVAVTFQQGTSASAQKFILRQYGIPTIGSNPAIFGVLNKHLTADSDSYTHFFGPEGVFLPKGFLIAGNVTTWAYVSITYEIV